MAVVTGINTVIESLKSKRKVYRVFISHEALKNKRVEEIRNLANDRNVRLVIASLKEIEEKLGRLKQHVAAEIEEFKYSNFEELIEKGAGSEKFCLVFLDGVIDPQNLGNIIRTAEFMGVGGMIIRKKRSAQITPVVERISQGATSFIPVARVANISMSLKKAKAAGFSVIGAEVNADFSLEEVELPRKCAFVVGGEDVGISRIVREECDYLVRISGSGNTTSLNAASCHAILIYQWAIKHRNNGES